MAMADKGLQSTFIPVYEEGTPFCWNVVPNLDQTYGKTHISFKRNVSVEEPLPTSFLFSVQKTLF